VLHLSSRNEASDRYLCGQIKPMRKLIWIGALIAAALGVYLVFFHETEKPAGPPPPKPEPVKNSKYSADFNKAISGLLNNYDSLSESFVRWDSAAVRHHGANLETSISGLSFDELKKDTVIYETVVSSKDNFTDDLKTIQSDNNMKTRRQSFNQLSENLYDLLRTIHYDAAIIYRQECSMAFGENTTGAWLSRVAAIRNPYLGLHDPYYKSGMLHCGETKDSLNFATPK
jgi:hypothetical protein